MFDFVLKGAFPLHFRLRYDPGPPVEAHPPVRSRQPMDKTTSTTASVPHLTIPAWDLTVTRTYEANRTGLVVAASRIVGRNDAADVAQEMFIRVWSHPDAFDESRGTLTRYLYMITRGMSIDRVRSLASAQARDTRDTERTRPRADDSGQRLSDAETRERVRRALSALREGERDVIVAAYFGHLTYKQVAVQLGIPEGTVKSRIRVGLVRLRAELGRTQVLAA